jgi:hypothetical protein
MALPPQAAAAASMLPETTLAFCLTEPGVLLFGEKKVVSNILASVKSGDVTANKKIMDLKAKVPPESLVWGIFAPNEKDKPAPAPGQQPQQASPSDSVKSGLFYLRTAGQAKKDIVLDLSLNCADAQAAAQTASQAQMTALFLIPSAFQSDPQLGYEAGQAFSVKPDGTSVSFKLSLTEALQKKMQTYFENTQKAAAAMSDDESDSDGAQLLGQEGKAVKLPAKPKAAAPEPAAKKAPADKQ